MSTPKSEKWLRDFASQHLTRFETDFRFFEEGDFGSLHQLEFNNDGSGGEIELWSSGWFRIHYVNYIQEVELINAFVGPDDERQDQLIAELIRRLADKSP